jgi:hypothetical protein
MSTVHLPYVPPPIEKAILAALSHHVGQHGPYRADEVPDMVADVVERAANPRLTTKYAAAIEARILYAATGQQP